MDITNRLNKLISRCFGRLEPPVKRLIGDCVVECYCNPNLNDGYAYTENLNKRNTSFKIVFAPHKLERLSDKAILGIISHEFGHVKDDYDKLHIIKKVEHYITKRGKLYHWKEKQIDKIAISWGFEQEIKQKDKET